MQHLTESTKLIGHNSPKPLRTKNFISKVKMMKLIPRNATEIQSNRKMCTNDKEPEIISISAKKMF